MKCFLCLTGAPKPNESCEGSHKENDITDSEKGVLVFGISHRRGQTTPGRVSLGGSSKLTLALPGSLWLKNHFTVLVFARLGSHLLTLVYDDSLWLTLAPTWKILAHVRSPKRTEPTDCRTFPDSHRRRNSPRLTMKHRKIRLGLH